MLKTFSFGHFKWLFSFLLLFALDAQAQINLSTTHTENFDGIGTSATAALPSSWKMSAAGITADWSTPTNVTTTTHAASSLSPIAGGRYNWGDGSNTSDRAIGFMTSGSYASPNTIMVHFKNITGGTLDAISIAFSFERYRVNSAAASVTFFTSSDGIAWSARTAGDIATSEFPTGSSSYTFTGGTVVNRSFTVSGLSIAHNGDFYLRWVVNTSGTNSQGIGLDNVTVTAVPQVSISSGTIGASSVPAGTNNVVLQRYDLGVSTNSATFNGLTITTAGTYGTSDLSNLKLWHSTDNTWDSGDELLATISSPSTAGNQSFPSFSRSLNIATHYIFVTTDISSSASNGKTINIATTPFSNISFVSAIKSGGSDPVDAAGVKTISSSLLPQTITFDPLAAATYGDSPITLTATASSGLAVSYSSSNTSVATISGSTLTILGSGTTNITASQSGNSTYEAADDVTRTLTVNAKNLTVSGVVVANKAYNGSTLATVSNTGTLSGVVSGDVVSISTNAIFDQSDVGTAINVTLSLTGTDAANYTLTQPGVTANITQANQSITFGLLPSKLTSDPAFNLSATASSGLTVSYASSNTAVATVSGSTVTIVGVGSTVITASQSGNANYLAASNVSRTLNVVSVLTYDEFADGDFTASPAWGGNTSNFAVSTSSALPNGSASTDGFFLASNANVGKVALSMPSTETSEWRFSLGSPDFDPSDPNFFGAILMSDVQLSGDITATSWNGYYLKIGVNSTPDPIELWRRSGSTSTKIGNFSTPSYSVGALKDGVNLRITRSSSGVFTLFYASGFTYSAIPTTSAGSLTDNTHSTSSYFGVYTIFNNASTSRRVYIDNIELGQPITNPTSSSVSSHTAVLGANLIQNAGALEAGIVWATTPNPTISNNKVVASGLSDPGAFQVGVQNLVPATKIYYRGFVTKDYGTIYTTLDSFTTLSGLVSTLVSGQKASLVLGQNDFVSKTAGLSNTKFNTPRGLAIDWVNNKVYVADATNNRVLRYSYPMSNSSVPELVFGQSNFTDSTSGLTANKFNRPIAVKVDNMGRLWVADAKNRRVLWFNNAHSISSNQPNANGVLGQANFTENLTGCSQNQFAGIRGIELDQFSNLYVADYSNNRVLRFDNAALKSNGADADAVFGQIDFVSNAAATSANGLQNPSSVSVIGSTLWVTDQKNNRTLKFNNANTVTANPTAAAVLGQSNFTTGTLATTASGQNGPFESFADAKGNLWVVDAANNRVLIYNSANSKSNGAAADLVLGQGSFTTKNPFTSQSGLSLPRAVVVHPQDLSVWVSDAGNHRILGYESVLPLVSHEAVSSSSVGAYSAVLNGELDGDLIAEAGFVWSSSNNMPTVSDNKVRASGVITDGSLSVWVQNLPAETTIYFRSYAVNPVGISYSAASSFTTGAATDFAVSNGQAATFVIGQTNFTNRVLSLGDTGLNAPRGIAIDAKNGKLYVSDSKNNRVLRFAYPLSDTIGASAELVLGQSDFASNTSGNSSNRFNDPRGLAVDNQGRLWVCDFANNRVVWFNNAHSISSNQPSANGVFGNSAFGVRSTAKTAQLYRPSSVVVDNDGNLWVADSYHHRVLRFNNAALKLNGANADAVLGQSDFVTVSSGLSQSAFNEPTGLDIKGDTLYVADSKNNRVLRFNGASLKANGANADAVLGQSNFTSSGVALTGTGMNLPTTCAVDAEGTLWVGDNGNRRILGYFEARTAGNGGSADVVLGQANFTTSVLNVTASRTSSNFAIAVDPERKYLFSADQLRHRVLGFALEGISGGPRKEAPVQEQTLRRELVAYPNPTSGSIRFDFGLIEGETYNLVIFDMAGRSVWTASQQGNMDQSVDLTSLPKGIYLARFNTSQGYQSTVRIVVE